jgi:hypothetical protein
MLALGKINTVLGEIRGTLWNSIRSMLQRGETVESLLEATQRLQESSKLFDRETEKQVATPLQRVVYWVCPCWSPLKRWWMRPPRETHH